MEVALQSRHTRVAIEHNHTRTIFISNDNALTLSDLYERVLTATLAMCEGGIEDEAWLPRHSSQLLRMLLATL